MPRPAVPASAAARPRPTDRSNRSRRPGGRPATMRMNLAIDTRSSRQIIDLARDPHVARRLPRGKAGGRYECLACGKKLIFTGPSSPTSHFTPRFRHEGTSRTDRCAAPIDVQQQIAADLTAVLRLRDQLARAWPTAELAVEACPRFAVTAHPLPPAIVARHAGQTIVIERPRRPLADTAVRNRLQTVRTRHGQVQHWWFFDHDSPMHYRSAGTVQVRVFGKPVTHHTVQPTAVQRQITDAGARLCWLWHDTALIPYGAHPFTYTPHAGEDWSGPMASWSSDWHLSAPSPAPGAAWWGVIPLPLTSFTSTPQHFGLQRAQQITDALRRSETGREAHRRGLARDHHQHLHGAKPVQLLFDVPATEQTTAAALPQAPSAATDLLSSPRVTPVGRRWNWRRLLKVRNWKLRSNKQK